jgi:hypothetical protein
MSFSQLDAQREALPFFMTAAELDQTLDTEVQFQYGLETFLNDIRLNHIEIELLCPKFDLIQQQS